MNKVVRLILRISIWSIGLSVAFGAAAFMLAPKTWVVSVYLWPGTYVGAALARLVPLSLMYCVVPEGGAPAFLLLVLIGAFVSWAILFAACQTLWSRYKQGKKSRGQT
jgi:hypothetical protein